MKSAFVLILGVVLIGIGACFYLHQPANVVPLAPSTHNQITNVTSTSLSDALMPLYKGVNWGSAYATSIEDIQGVAATSSAGTNIDNIAAVTTPFSDYYRSKLKADGWEDDLSHEAGGAGSTIDAYKKGDQLIFISFNTKFKGTQPDEPVSCPCDVTLQVFEGKNATTTE